MSRQPSTFRRAVESTLNGGPTSRAGDAARRVLEQWRSGARCDLPSALQQSPSILEDRSVFLDLVQNEFRHQREDGEAPSPSDYCKRFPTLDNDLLRSVHRLIEVEQYLGAHPDLLRLAGDPPWPAEGDEFEGIQLDQELGRGALSRVFLGRELTLGDRRVVIKVTTGARREASVLGKLDHPNIVPVYSTGVETDTGLAWICMPYLGRTTLHDALRYAFDGRRPRSGAELRSHVTGGGAPQSSPTLHEPYEISVIRIAHQLADALAYVHQRGILHGDLKPSNVLLTDRAVPMLIDFNLAQDAGAVVGLIGGTLPYMAPEQLEVLVDGCDDAHPRTTAASDGFAFGVMLYQMLLGRLPLDIGPPSSDIEVTARRLLEARLRDPAGIARELSGVDRRLTRLVVKCLSVSLEQRPAHFDEIRSTLAQILDERSRWARYARRTPYAVAALVLTGTAISLAAALAAPRTSAAILREADSLATAGDLEESVALLSPLVAARPELLGARRQLASRLLQIGEIESAGEHFMSAWRSEGEPLDAAAVGYCSNRNGDHAFAVGYYRVAKESGLKSVAVENNFAASLVHQLRDHFDNELSRAAERMLLEAYALAPNNESVRLNMMWHYSVCVRAGRRSVPGYPVEIARPPSDVVSVKFCVQALEFLVERRSNRDELSLYGLECLTRLGAMVGIDDASRFVRPQVLEKLRELPGYRTLPIVARTIPQPDVPEFLNPLVWYD